MSGRIYVRRMISLRHIALPASILLAGLAAAPAHATLLVRADGGGLLVRDKHNLDDRVTIRNDYTVLNQNAGDIFSFDAQTGCTGQNEFRRAFCDRNGPVMTIQLLAGRDVLRMEGTVPAGIANVTAGAGDDFVFGHKGKDNPVGGSGDDHMEGASGDDTLAGSLGADTLEGGNGTDTLLGEDGNDVLIGDRGQDVLRGGPNNDFLNAREPDGSTSGEDALDCGSGFDAVEADLKDAIQADCEEVDRAPVGETPNVILPGKTLRVSGNGRVRARLRCPRGVRSLGCNGRLRLRVPGGSGSRRAPYRIKAGARKAVTLKLTPGAVRTIRRRGRAARGVLTSVERGRLGRKTTIRNPRLRVR